jgi:hypothetical protein
MVIVACELVPYFRQPGLKEGFVSIISLEVGRVREYVTLLVFVSRGAVFHFNQQLNLSFLPS